MVDKTTIDRSLKEAFKGEKLDSEFGDVKKELGAHKDELTGSLDGLHEHAKANKLLNILQVADMARNLNRDKEVRDEAAEAKNDRDKSKKAQRRGAESRERIEGGIDDIKDMISSQGTGGAGGGGRETQSDKLKGLFSNLKKGAGTGPSRQALNANNIIADFATKQMTGANAIEEFRNKMEGASDNDRNDFLKALNAVAEVGQGREGKTLTKAKRKTLAEAGRKVGIDIDTDQKASLRDLFQRTNKSRENFGMMDGLAIQESLWGSQKELKTMSQQGRLSVPKQGVGRSGADVESWPEKNFEVLEDIYELLEKWFNEWQMNGGSGGMDPFGLPFNRRGRTNVNSGGNRGGNRGPQVRGNPVVSRTGTGNPTAGYTTNNLQGTRVQAQNGQWYNRGSTQANAIENMSKPGRVPGAEGNPIAGNTGAGGGAGGGNSMWQKFVRGTQSTTGFIGSTNRVLDTVAKNKAFRWGARALGPVLEGWDTFRDIQGIEERTKLNETDEGYIREDIAQDLKDNEKKEGLARTGGGLAGFAAATLATGAIVSTTGVGAIVGVPLGIIGAGLAYWAGSEAAEEALDNSSLREEVDLDAAKESGFFTKRGALRDSVLDKDMDIKQIPTEQIQAILRAEGDDLAQEDLDWLREELQRRGGNTALTTAQREEAAALEEQQLLEKQEALDTSGAIDNLDTELSEEELAAAGSGAGGTINDNKTIINNPKEIQPEVIISEGQGSNDVGSWWTSMSRYSTTGSLAGPK